MEIKLALGGGGAKGVAHLGVLRCLENSGYRVCAIAGTSAGGIVAALYAAGFRVDEMIEAFEGLEFRELFRRQPEEEPALFGLAGVRGVLEGFLGERNFTDLEMPCAVTAVDLISGIEVELNKGRVLDSVLATIALPGIFPPQKIGDKYLVDGGLLDPVPVESVRALASTQPVVAVALSSAHPNPDLEAPAFLRNLPFLNQIARLRIAQAFNIFFHSMEIASISMSKMRLEIDKPDVLIRPPVEDIGLFDRVNVHEVVDRGEEATKDKLTEIKQAFDWRRKVGRYWNYLVISRQ